MPFRSNYLDSPPFYNLLTNTLRSFDSLWLHFPKKTLCFKEQNPTINHCVNSSFSASYTKETNFSGWFFQLSRILPNSRRLKNLHPTCISQGKKINLKDFWPPQKSVHPICDEWPPLIILKKAMHKSWHSASLSSSPGQTNLIYRLVQTKRCDIRWAIFQE
jgi:hypothetical protein